MIQVGTGIEGFLADGRDGIGRALIGDLLGNHDVAAIGVLIVPTDVSVIGDFHFAVFYIIINAVNNEVKPVTVTRDIIGDIAKDLGEILPR